MGTKNVLPSLTPFFLPTTTDFLHVNLCLNRGRQTGFPFTRCEHSSVYWASRGHPESLGIMVQCAISKLHKAFYLWLTLAENSVTDGWWWKCIEIFYNVINVHNSKQSSWQLVSLGGCICHRFWEGDIFFSFLFNRTHQQPEGEQGRKLRGD